MSKIHSDFFSSQGGISMSSSQRGVGLPRWYGETWAPGGPIAVDVGKKPPSDAPKLAQIVVHEILAHREGGHAHYSLLGSGSMGFVYKKGWDDALTITSPDYRQGYERTDIVRSLRIHQYKTWTDFADLIDCKKDPIVKH